MKGLDKLRKTDLQNERLYLKTLNNEKNSAVRQTETMPEPTSPSCTFIHLHSLSSLVGYVITRASDTVHELCNR